MQRNKIFQSKESPPQPEPDSTPTGRKIMRPRLQNIFNRYYPPLFVGLAIIAGFISLLIFNLTEPPPQNLTQKDINHAIVLFGPYTIH